ncbi:uncharacterized protein [Triticum aestivum]|uniref:uncharacterized protein isoform X6 n=1 Tax=Triticum aestivum TaxID=4565 RepID=UPI001D002D69|nr:uncharacterized protein LOC123105250 isoform X6 [Triticum aestivum]XP_044383221.1 uncharacterized protein LOC123105250 isoform X6 [Triticum aestivum]
MVPCPIDIVNNAIDDHLAKRLTELCGSENKLVVGSSEYKRIIEMNLGIACLYVDVPDCEIIIWSQMNPVRTLLGFPTGDMTIVLLYEAPVGIAIFSFDGDYLNDPAKVLIFSLLMLLKIWLSSMTNSRSSNRLLCFFYMTFGGRLGDVLILGGRERGGGEFDQRKQLCNLFLQLQAITILQDGGTNQKSTNRLHVSCVFVGTDLQLPLSSPYQRKMDGRMYTNLDQQSLLRCINHTFVVVN